MSDNFLDEPVVSVDKKNDSINTLWVEKYRPTKVDDYIGNDHLKKSLNKYISENDVPHILLYSKSSGTGKTSAAKLLIKNIACDYLYINASDENSVDDVRTKIKGFASTLGFQKLKIVILDEADQVSFEGQAALRNLMETYSKSTRFIITCNYIEKIIRPVWSRCQVFEVIPPSKKDIAKHIDKILNLEKITHTNGDLGILVNSFYPDLRKMLNTAQQNAFGGVLKLDDAKTVEMDAKLKIVDILKKKEDKKKKFTSIRQLIADSQLHDFSSVYSYLYEHIDEFAGEHVPGVIMVVAESSHRDTFAVDHELQFADCVVKILTELEAG